MAEICCGEVSTDNESPPPPPPPSSSSSCEAGTRAARRRRMEIRRFKFITSITTTATGTTSRTRIDSSPDCTDSEIKRQKLEIISKSPPSPSLSSPPPHPQPPQESSSLYSSVFNRGDWCSHDNSSNSNAVENCITVTEPVIINEESTTAAENETSRSSSSSLSSTASSSKESMMKDVTTIYESQVLAVKALDLSPSTSVLNIQSINSVPKFGVASVCGRRRDMEDAVAVHPSFFRRDGDEDDSSADELHYFAVYDGHGCSHVANKCRDRLHELVREELLMKKDVTSSMIIEEENDRHNWEDMMKTSFNRMDKEVMERFIEEQEEVEKGGCSTGNGGGVGLNSNSLNCRCEFQSPDQFGAVGSTAVVAIVNQDKIIVANCGDSRAVLCRNGKPVPLSSDHKPDRPDELNRIQEAGGRVIYWDGPRVLGVLAMSRAIGDNYLKPYVSCEPEVTITDRTPGDDCLILASDGLWDVVSNDTACGVARMCLRGKLPKGMKGRRSSSPNTPPALPEDVMDAVAEDIMADKACSDASTLLTKLALARHSTDNVSVVVIDLRKDT